MRTGYVCVTMFVTSSVFFVFLQSFLLGLTFRFSLNKMQRFRYDCTAAPPLLLNSVFDTFLH